MRPVLPYYPLAAVALPCSTDAVSQLNSWPSDYGMMPFNARVVFLLMGPVLSDVVVPSLVAGGGERVPGGVVVSGPGGAVWLGGWVRGAGGRWRMGSWWRGRTGLWGCWLSGGRSGVRWSGCAWTVMCRWWWRCWG